MLSMAFLPFVSYGQKGTWTSGFHVQRSGWFNSEFKTIDIGTDFVGYNFTDNSYANLRYEYSTAMFKSTEHYTSNHSFGINTGYHIFKAKDYRVGVQVGIGTTAWRKRTHWKYTYYEGLAYIDCGSGKFKPRFSIGVRYNDSHDEAYKNRLAMVMGIGFTL